MWLITAYNKAWFNVCEIFKIFSVRWFSRYRIRISETLERKFKEWHQSVLSEHFSEKPRSFLLVSCRPYAPASSNLVSTRAASNSVIEAIEWGKKKGERLITCSCQMNVHKAVVVQQGKSPLLLPHTRTGRKGKGAGRHWRQLLATSSSVLLGSGEERWDVAETLWEQATAPINITAS